MKLSVVMPVYNEHATLRTVVERVLSVKDISLELICIDDGSRDGTRAVVEAWVQRDARLQLIVQKNAGVAAARLNIAPSGASVPVRTIRPPTFETGSPNRRTTLRSTHGNGSFSRSGR